MIQKLLQFNNHLYFWLLCAFSLLFAYLGNRFLFTESLYYSTLNEQYTNEQIRTILNLRNTWVGISYLLIPVFIIIRVLFTSFCLFLGDLFQELNWGFKRLFNVALKADAVFVLSAISVFYYYIIFGNYQTMNDLNVHPFSLLAIEGQKSIPNWLVFAFNSMNIFELIYILFLIFFINSMFKISYLKSSVFVLITYGIGNYLYIVAITFLYLNM